MGAYALLRELGERLAPRQVLYLASALPRRPADLVAALPATSHLTVVSSERRAEPPTSDVLVTVIAGDPRYLVHATGISAELVFIDGVDVPFVASLFFPVPRSSWLFTEQGWRALFARVGESGAVVIERSQATPEDFARLTRALPAGVGWAAAECSASLIPAAALPCAWIGLSRSEATLASVREAFAATAGARPLEVAAAAPPRVATDDRPIVIFPEKLYAVQSGGALVIVVALVWLRRRKVDAASAPARRQLRTAAAGLALVQVAVAVSLGRASASPGLSIPLLSALGWLALGAALWVFASRTSGARGSSPFAFATISVGAALAASLTALAVASPFPNRALAIPLVVLRCAARGGADRAYLVEHPRHREPRRAAAGAGSVFTGYASVSPSHPASWPLTASASRRWWAP
ncbi:MAG: hypothetical protein IPK07_22425 [Deltaproteobacteria bacterium]|nr:hypothetical protein [Deltaproteobacteria bacterium]